MALVLLCVGIPGQAWLAWGGSSVIPAGGRTPNILFILTDDLGINDLGCYGRTDHRTPRLDSLARQGLRFASAYCAQPICSASRTALLTGKSPARIGLTTYLPGRADCAAQPLLHPEIPAGLPLAEVTVAERLKALGYVTGFLGKWHLGGRGLLPTDQGFDRYVPGRPVTTPDDREGSKGESFLTAAAEQFLEENRTRPFFLLLSHDTPHIPYAATPAEMAQNSAAFEPAYAAVVARLDLMVGRLLDALDRLGLADNTVVIFTSDNGGLHVPELSHARITHNTPFRAGKGYLYEGGLRIPQIVRWPGTVPAGKVTESPVLNADWPATLVEIAGGDRQRTADGVSIVPILKGRGTPERRPLAWHFPHYTNQGGQPSGALREGDWKLIEHYEDGRTELFHLGRDPGETTDVGRTNPRRVRRMKAQLEAWRIASGARRNAPNPGFDPAAHARLHAEFEPSRFNPLTASPTDWTRVATWRKAMDEAVARPRP